MLTVLIKFRIASPWMSSKQSRPLIATPLLKMPLRHDIFTALCSKHSSLLVFSRERLKNLLLWVSRLARRPSRLSCLHATHSSSPPSIFPPLPSTQSISLWVSVSEPWGVWQAVCHFITDLPPSSPPPPTLFFSLLSLFSSLAHLLAVSPWPLLSPLPLFITLPLFLPDLFSPLLFSISL